MTEGRGEACGGLGFYSQAPGRGEALSRSEATQFGLLGTESGCWVLAWERQMRSQPGVRHVDEHSTQGCVIMTVVISRFSPSYGSHPRRPFRAQAAPSLVSWGWQRPFPREL